MNFSKQQNHIHSQSGLMRRVDLNVKIARSSQLFAPTVNRPTTKESCPFDVCRVRANNWAVPISAAITVTHGWLVESNDVSFSETTAATS